MSLVTVLRSPSTSDSTSLGDSEVDEDQEDNSLNRSRASSFEGFFASKGAAYALPDGDFARRATKHGGEMQLHLQAMVNLLRDEDVLRLVVKLESQYPNRIRYVTIVSAFGLDEEEQSIVIGVDWTDKATIGLVVPLYRDTTIKLDGDGGFIMSSANKTNIFKPVSVQTMWTALQWIHKCSDNARRHNYYPNGSSHAWVEYYYRKISSDRICLNEWHQMEDIESKRPESPIGTSREKELVMKLIRHKLREIMMKVDLEDVTSRQVRAMLEEDTQMELKEYRSFIDEEMFTIMGQMDSASKIFDHVYLGSEWNASNLEELKENGVEYILNVTREIDNFFPGTFHYHNIRVYDLDETELLHHWDNTYRFIQKAKNAGSSVLVHCRMGISRSASTVIAYGMKEYGWSLGDTMKYVKARRSVVQPNAGFWKQLITYEGILNSSKHRYNKLFNEAAACDTETKRQGKKTANKTYDILQSEGMDTVDNLPIETETDMAGNEFAVFENQDSEAIWGIAEDTDDGVFFKNALFEKKDEDSLPLASSPVKLTFEPSEAVVEETDSVQPTSRVSEIPVIEKTALYRVSSVPAIPSGDRTSQESNADNTGNFQRSSSLRVRGPKKVQHLRTFIEGKAASDENITEFGLKKKGIVGSIEENLSLSEPHARNPEKLEVTEKESLVEGPCLGTESCGSLPRELHGVLESGFVKRKSRNFEEGVYNMPSAGQVLDDGANPENEMDVVYLSGETDKPPTTEEEQIESNPSEEPEPGVVKKHKEEYELKHRESLKRGAVLQRGGSWDESSSKRERGEMSGDSDSKSLQAEGGSEGERVRDANMDALVQKVNEDMKKEVSTRRISKKELELRAFVRQAGEQMKDVLANGEDKNLNDNSVTDLGSRETTKMLATAEPIEEKVKERPLEDPQLTERSPECTETITPKGEINIKGSIATDVEQVQSSVVQNPSADTSDLPVDREDMVSERDKESIPQKGLVKRHTLLIEERLQPVDQLGKEAEDEDEKESEQTVEQGGGLRSRTEGETTSAATVIEPVQPSVARDVNTEPSERETCDLRDEMEDRASTQDTENVPQKGLVKRQTLLIEGKLQPLEQVLVKDAENEDDQETSSSPSTEETLRAYTDPERAEPGVKEDVSADVQPTEKEKNSSAREETGSIDDAKDKASEQDVELLSQKGLVKRHTLFIEGKLQPLVQDVNNEDTSQGEATVDQEVCTSSSVDQEKRYQVERTSKPTEAEAEEDNQDGETVSGLVKREKLRIENGVKPTVEEAQESKEEDPVVACNDGPGLKARMDESFVNDDKKENDEGNQLGGKLEGQEQSKVGVDTSSVVRVKDHTQHLEGIISVTTSTKDGEKMKRQTSKEELSKSRDELPKIVIVPRSCSDEAVEQGNELSRSGELLEDKMEEILSDSAVNVALMKAQENLDLENEKFLDWEVANVKQRTQIFEDIMRHFGKGTRKGEPNSDNPVRRCASMPKTIRTSEKYVLRRRSFSDLTETVSSSSGREVGYTIQFDVGESSSSSSLPRDWSPLQERQGKETWDEPKTKDVLSPEIYCKDELKSEELFDCQDKENDSLSVKEKIQVLISKNQRNISDAS